MSEKYILSIFAGSTSVRSTIFNHDGLQVISFKKDITPHIQHNGWYEQDAIEIWDAVSSTIANALIVSEIHPDQIASIGITNQRETTVIWNKKTGIPIYSAIAWQSRQTKDIAYQWIRDGYSDFFQKKTGLRIDAYFSATKVRWILDNVSGAQEAANHGDLLFGTIDTWVLWNLTKGKTHTTDYTNASRTMLFNLLDLQWDTEILTLLHIPNSMMPNIKSNSEIYGYTDPDVFFGSSVPIAGMAGDQQAAFIGNSAFKPGVVKNSYGTGAFIMMNIGESPKISNNKLLTTVAYGINHKVYYALEGSIFVAGSAINWLKNGLEMIDDPQESSKLALQSSQTNSLYIVPSFTGLGAPYWDPDAKGAAFGITEQTNRNDFIKATLQSIAYQAKDVINTMENDSNIRITSVRADGGISRNDYLMQFQADLLHIPVNIANTLETKSLGVAFLAGLAVGYWENLNEVQKIYSPGAIFNPVMENAESNNLYEGWRNAVQATRVYKHVPYQNN
ncbi:glycerol kinase GlpK [Pediococcus claussenii]|uniref:glycerol kinase n=1 Tax=Pediococcus claussenii (strain ATCC BAA-344 / DSM 14800 / JCM 18046 / KCTC 3811 / LMG 21948 / P06) TaxID=701521 RepID=G8PEI1_PEDCP|nr:glycerol kinase GlpK [Pediococcus claussenii]AEV95590.1 glycerol kinase [Pediococcus claussenii ATCC BAA-344]ANZ69111.1 glycerol kinase [Pediococcus claussenii]ANZ70928.1 glycerol kinase [Pediococcus claussenii]KRN20177.1 glpK protein [Pediococcus claussenii]